MMNIPREEILRVRSMVDELRPFQLIHYRELHKEINETNYQICTRVDFQPIEQTHDNIEETWGRLKHKFTNSITSEYESNKQSGSKYFTTDAGFAYRLSNHWGMVKTCIWTRAGEGNFIASEMISGPTQIGQAHLSEFKIHRMKHHWKKDLIINPEWVKKIVTIKEINDTLLQLKNSPEFKGLPGEDKKLIGSNQGLFMRQLAMIPE